MAVMGYEVEAWLGEALLSAELTRARTTLDFLARLPELDIDQTDACRRLREAVDLTAGALRRYLEVATSCSSGEASEMDWHDLCDAAAAALATRKR